LLEALGLRFALYWVTAAAKYRTLLRISSFTFKKVAVAVIVNLNTT